MRIKRVGEGDHFVCEDPDITVSFSLPGYVVLLAGDLQQMFSNPRHATFKQLAAAFPNLAKVQEAAECYTEGVTNKQRFLKCINDQTFCKQYAITELDRRILTEYIAATTFAPPTVRQQLYMKGYRRIADVIDFSDVKEEFTKTCALFWEFVSASRTNPL